MTAINAGGGWVRALAVTALLWGFMAAAQTAPPTMVMTTAPVTGAAFDTVVASVADVGVSRGGTLTVTLRILSASGAVLAEVTGPVSESSPLRVSTRAPTSGGVRAQLVLPWLASPLSAGVMAIERWDPLLNLTSSTVICVIPHITIDPGGGTNEPVTTEQCPYLLRP